jgi:hypothetical protein
MRGKTGKPINHIEYGAEMAHVVILPLRLGPAPEQIAAGRLQIRVRGGRTGTPGSGDPAPHKTRHGRHPGTRPPRVEE